jgi:hypothetical protein
MKFKLELNIENTGLIDEAMRNSIEEIINALITSGGLTGVKGGRTIIHFDLGGHFQRIELNYCPYIKRNKA